MFFAFSAPLRFEFGIAGAIAIGIRRQSCRGAVDGGVELNPGRDRMLELEARDELIVVSL
ncbi:hypothetical protein F2Q65_12800 [Thiohalocapsa marina]|uniref:Uncharacterized protein n=1 Tax=Thiohalocapsa marina TaxID=424902 RepID=A0A5M8FPH6_9GAMM|nr:hypothetical protein [Thiohalocapsa marina]KAA6184335.1 hypothetical protein F2Q65_12800 [Thiohalocapsa marina]